MLNGKRRLFTVQEKSLVTAVNIPLYHETTRRQITHNQTRAFVDLFYPDTEVGTSMRTRNSDLARVQR